MSDNQQVEPTDSQVEDTKAEGNIDVEKLKEELAQARTDNERYVKEINQLRKENAGRRVTANETKAENSELLERLAALEQKETERQVQAKRVEIAAEYQLPASLIDFLGDDLDSLAQRAKTLASHLGGVQVAGGKPKPRPVSEAYGGLEPRKGTEPFDAAELARRLAKK